MNIADRNNSIKHLIYNKLIPYSITVTYLLPEYIQDYGSNIFYNQYFLHKDLAATKSLDKYKNKLEASFRLVLNKLISKALGTSNITRTTYKNQHPITFYEFQLSNKEVREKTITEKPHFRHVSPLHIHALMLLPESVQHKFSCYIGQDTLHQYGPLGQTSDFRPCDDVDRWMNYIERDYLAPPTNEGVHPSKFACDPYGFIGHKSSIPEEVTFS